ncbi:MAG: DNA polymerase, partial [Pyrinomonadaceae bacterium]
VAHNAKFDAKWICHHLGVEIGGVFDTMLASQLISAGNGDRHGLAPVAARYLNQEVDKAEQSGDWSGELTSTQLSYAAQDARLLLPLESRLRSELEQHGLTACARLEFECVLPIARLELNGIYIDPSRWREQLKIVEEKRLKLADELQEMLSPGAQQGSLFGPATINLDSHTQLTEAIRRIGVPLPDSTRNWQLQPMADQYPVIGKLLEYRTVQKAKSSYGENILEEISSVTGRIHPDFHQIGAGTGRFSCKNPNIQQVPSEFEYRRCFRAPDGKKLVVADYSQIELRILAEFSGDHQFINAFKSGADLHRVTASEVFGVAPEAVTSDQRSFAKRLNFGVVYGIGASRFSTLTGLGTTESEGIMRKYFSTYSGLDRWLREAAANALKYKEARTASGRVARFDFDPNDRQAASSVQRNGKNMPIQGTSADILKRALRLLHDELATTSGRIVNIIHDEVVVEVDQSEADAVAGTVECAMRIAGEEFLQHVPIIVDAKISDEWVK